MKNTLGNAALELNNLNFRALRWDGEELEVITQRGEAMIDSEFKVGSKTRQFMEQIDEECYNKCIPPFMLILMGD